MDKLVDNTTEKKPNRSIWNSLKQVLPYTLGLRKRIALVVLGSIIFGVLRLVDPNIYKEIVDMVFVPLTRGEVTLQSSLPTMLKLCGLMLAAMVCRAAIYSVYTYISLKTMLRMEAKMYRDALTHLQSSLDMGFHSNRNSGEIMARVDRGIEAVNEVLHSDIAKSFLPNSINALCLLILMFWQDWRLATAACMLMPIHIWISWRKAKIIKQQQPEINRLYEKIGHRMSEGVRNIEAIITCDASQHELEMFDQDRAKAMDRQEKVAMQWRIQGFSASLFGALGYITVALTGWYLIGNNQVTLGVIVNFLAYISMLYQPMMDMMNTYLTVQVNLSKVDRLTSLLGERPKVYELEGAVDMPPLRHSIEVCDVSFSYDGNGNHALHNISLVIPAGKKIAVVGPTGTGKSTFVNLVQRYFDPTNGIITFDGTGVRKLTFESLRRQVAVVPQHALLFSRTIGENIAYGKSESTAEEIEQAAKIANAHEFIMEKPKGYSSMIGEHGVHLSGGQQQRVSIARAVIRNASLIILDEATSHLDSESESIVQEALWKLMDGRTALIIAHRLSTIINADAIIVMDQGRIIDYGPHSEILKRCELYQRLYEKQFSHDISRQ